MTTTNSTKTKQSSSINQASQRAEPALADAKKSSGQQASEQPKNIHPAITGNPNVVLYHNDWDGVAAAWVIKKALEAGTTLSSTMISMWDPDKVDYVPVQYGYPVPEGLEGKNVLIVDFSYKRFHMLELKRITKVLRCLDHHKTAKAELEGLHWCTFDMNKAGCILAWEYCNDPADKPPLFLKYVDDRDRWVWKLHRSHAMNAMIRSYQMTFESCDKLHNIFSVISGLEEVDDVLFRMMALEGKAILRFQQRQIEGAVKHGQPMLIDGYVGLGVNMPDKDMISQVGEALCDEFFVKGTDEDDQAIKSKPAFGVCWFRAGDKWVYSMRSRNGFDVSEIAKKLGGGGHMAAAGFQSDNPPWYYENLFKEASVLKVTLSQEAMLDKVIDAIKETKLPTEVVFRKSLPTDEAKVVDTVKVSSDDTKPGYLSDNT